MNPNPTGNNERRPRAAVAVWRIVDANLNRALEGLRVVEEYARFVCNDAHLAGLCKQLRHDVNAAAASVSVEQRMAGRETTHDVGVALETASEKNRTDSHAVMQASCHRVQEALRCLEEYGKLLGPQAKDLWAPLRYRTYTLQRAFEISRAGRTKLASARLYVLTPECDDFQAFTSLIDQLVEAGVDIVQLRAKGLADRELLARARYLRQATLGAATLFIINDRPDLAVLADADGVHLGQDDLSVFDARRIVGADCLIGVSTHSMEQARQAVLDGADYLGVGPTFPSSTKHFKQFPGVALMAQVNREISLPHFAIGGLTADNIEQVKAAAEENNA